MFSCYLKLERRQTIKKDGTESKTPRYVATRQAGYFKPLEALKNKSGGIIMYHQRNDKCNPNSTSETRLQCKNGVNFSSVYFTELKADAELIGHGEPPQAPTLKGNKQNPFYSNKADGYLFILSPDGKTIEILVVPQGRMLIAGYAARLKDGALKSELDEVRTSATTL